MKMFFRIGIIVGLMLPGMQPILAQSQEALDKIQSAKIALITERLELTPEQAEKFWPLYHEYSRERQTLRQEYRTFRQSNDGRELSEEESKRLLEQGQRLKERQLNIDKVYSERLNQVISNRQMLQLRTAEDDFRRMLLERLQQRSTQMEDRERMQQRMDRRNNQ